MKTKLITIALFTLALIIGAHAQWPLAGFGNTPTNRSVLMTAANTFQTITLPTTRFTITDQNNNINGDNCWIEYTGAIAPGTLTTANVATANQSSMPSIKAAVLLSGNGGAFGRYTFTPTGPFVAACTGLNDSIYMETQ